MNGMLQFLLIVVLFAPGEWSHYQLACHGFSVSSLSSFHGARLQLSNDELRNSNSHSHSHSRPSSSCSSSGSAGEITMRKQKASNRRTRRMQLGGEELTQAMIREKLSRREVTITSSPMTQNGEWKQRRQGDTSSMIDVQIKTGGRGRSRKRSLLYTSLSLYYNKFLNFLTKEYKAEVSRSQNKTKQNKNTVVSRKIRPDESSCSFVTKYMLYCTLHCYYVFFNIFLTFKLINSNPLDILCDIVGRRGD